MSFPSSGFNPGIVRYNVALEGSLPPSWTLEVDFTRIPDDDMAEDICDKLDTWLVNMAHDMENVDGVTGSHVYKSFIGETSTVDLA